MSVLKFGWAEVSLTPDRKVSLAGQFAERISEYVEKPVTATALAVSSKEEQMVLVSCDLVGVSWNLVEAVRTQLVDNGMGLDPEKIIISATHAHTAPEYTRKGRLEMTRSFQEMLTPFLPADKKYVEEQNISDNPDIIEGDEMLAFLVEGMRKAGKRIAGEIIEVYEEGLEESQEEPVFVHHVHAMQLPIRRATLAQEIEAKKEIHDYLRDKVGDVDYNDAAKQQRYVGILQRMEEQDVYDTLDTEVHTIRLGDIAIATNPFELFLDFGNQIKARSLAEQTFLIQLANGAEGYLPTKKAEEGGHYSAFISSGQVGHEGGEQLVRETLKNINTKLF